VIPVELILSSVLCLSLALLAAIFSYSLRNYSRSRLAEICRKAGNELRFGEILKGDIRNLTSWEFVQIAAASVGLLMLGPPILAGFTGPLGRSVGVTGIALLAAALWVVIPWTISRVAGEPVLYRAWPLITGVTRILRPVLELAIRIDTLLHRLAGREDPDVADPTSIAEEIQSVVDEGHRGGLLESRAGRMIQRVMELSEEDVRAVMTPRTGMICISREVTLEEARRQLLESGHSRVPVIGESPDDIVGILYAKDLLRHLPPVGNPVALTTILREPLYIPETTTIDDLLEQMRRERLHMAIVLDEYGGVVGLVTLEDILEQIVGEIVDEFDRAEKESIVAVDELTVDADARVHLDDLNEQFNYGLPEDEDFDTIGGFIFSRLGRIPESGETITWNQLRLTVLEADRRRVLKVRIVRDESLVPTHQQ
jgi:CBS domain containing-hemolysin-like protein